MDVIEAMKTTGTCRHFRADPVPDEVLMQAFEAARFAPQGGNRQPVRWVVVRDKDRKRRLAEWYLTPWKAYLAGIGAGEVSVGALPKAVTDADHFAEHLDEVPPSSCCAPSWTGCTPPTPNSAASAWSAAAPSTPPRRTSASRCAPRASPAP
ncbi:nitroreductase family protein [Actinomadura madurae]|uniref:nitroreductase family protein n=1 Tax=Actinomadura madurae TaxID=1993 RepID=UPI0020D2319D|nr:nitroreductase family protein [Actinomadura madurae]MCP9979247.1 nitroreductase family protein [Actinomadura madurae]